MITIGLLDLRKLMELYDGPRESDADDVTLGILRSEGLVEMDHIATRRAAVFSITKVGRSVCMSALEAARRHP